MMRTETYGEFCVAFGEKDTILSIKNQKDPHEMNWVEGEKTWGDVICPDGITVEKSHTWYGERLKEMYVFKNESSYPVYIQKGELGIYQTWNDNYQEAKTCLTKRCHTHIWCGGGASYVMALRMGGEGKHLGLKMVEGGLSGYSVVRDLDERSNDRGDFIMHPDIVCIQPGEEKKIAWEFFWFENKEDFYQILKASYDFLVMESSQFSYFSGESAMTTVSIRGNYEKKDILMFQNGSPVEFDWMESGDRKTAKVILDIAEEKDIQLVVHYKEKKTWSWIHGMKPLEELVEKRCQFLADMQQEDYGELKGAYLIYDNEEHMRYYSHAHDHNSCRERVAMGCLMALYLQKHKEKKLEESLDAYLEFIRREIFDGTTGDVCNDCHHNMDWDRMYNYPWMAQFFIEVYHLKKEKMYLKHAFMCMKRYYEKKGASFYAIGIPLVELYQSLWEEKMMDEVETIKKYAKEHAKIICENGLNYPEHEVNYEQSIVAPAVNILLQAYQLTGEASYLEEGKRHMNVLLLFNGKQPDYHMYENAIRHWDGYWFGKRRLYGDTFPHYWSTLTGVECVRMAQILRKNEKDSKTAKLYEKLACASLRGSLNLFRGDGSASCAHVYPHTVNGVKAGYYDPWANDQDWALYYAGKYEEVVRGKESLDL